MIVNMFAKRTDFTNGMITYSVILERRLDEKLWNKNVVFPFARQRQYDSIRTWSKWKLRQLGGSSMDSSQYPGHAIRTMT